VRDEYKGGEESKKRERGGEIGVKRTNDGLQTLSPSVSEGWGTSCVPLDDRIRTDRREGDKRRTTTLSLARRPPGKRRKREERERTDVVMTLEMRVEVECEFEKFGEGVAAFGEEGRVGEDVDLGEAVAGGRKGR
jgi:hypothetical protein